MPSPSTIPACDFVPVILGGDIGAYALGREFHEAYGCTSICLVKQPIGAILHSSIFRHVPLDSLEPDEVIATVERIHEEDPARTILFLTNSEACIPAVLAVRDALPYVRTPTPSRDVIDQVSHKDRFAELCREHGLDAPASEIPASRACSAPVSSLSVALIVTRPRLDSAEKMLSLYL